MIQLTEAQLGTLRDLARKHAGQTIDFINISRAQSLTELGLAVRQPSGWRISESGLALLAQVGPASQSSSDKEASSLRKFPHEGNQG